MEKKYDVFLRILKQKEIKNKTKMENENNNLTENLALYKYKADIMGSDLLIAFLDECKKAGYKKVAIQVRTEEIPDSITFPFGVDGNVFCMPEKRKDGWPAIWSICEKFKFGGCGNEHQHQIPTYLHKGFYVLENNRWVKK